MSTPDLERTLTAAETAAQATAPGATVRVPAEDWAFAQEVVRLARLSDRMRQELIAYRGQAERTLGQICNDLEGAEDALHAALAARPVGEEQPNGD